MADDDWTTAAMSDVFLVADLLVHLRQSSTPETDTTTTPLKWRARQRRSRPMVHSSCSKPTASPTTPLSWSGATSFSGGGFAADGVEESSWPPNDTARSKVTDAIENKTNKASRKKKTLAELKEDEALILKERIDLEKKLAALRLTLEIERATNNRLKRFKVDLGSKRVSSEEVASCSPFSADLRIGDGKSVDQPCLCNTLKQQEEDRFMLPDLNLPVDDPTT